jgi:hypothetical protein
MKVNVFLKNHKKVIIKVNIVRVSLIAWKNKENAGFGTESPHWSHLYSSLPQSPWVRQWALCPGLLPLQNGVEGDSLCLPSRSPTYLLGRRLATILTSSTHLWIFLPLSVPKTPMPLSCPDMAPFNTQGSHFQNKLLISVSTKDMNKCRVNHFITSACFHIHVLFWKLPKTSWLVKYWDTGQESASKSLPSASLWLDRQLYWPIRRTDGSQ